MKRAPQAPGELAIVLEGDPIPWARPRTNGKTGVWFESKEAKSHRRKLAQLMGLSHGKRHPLDGRAHGGTKPTPVSVVIRMTFTRPKSWDRKTLDPDGAFLMPTKPDIDNLEKLILDAAMDAGVLYDDGAVAMSTKVKVFSARGGKPSTQVTFKALPHGMLA